jgi:hypothetical protein
MILGFELFINTYVATFNCIASEFIYKSVGYEFGIISTQKSKHNRRWHQ